MNRSRQSSKARSGAKGSKRSQGPTPPLEVSEHPAIPRPSKSLGQNFLVDKRAIERIVNSLQPTSDETIVEIGPGQGALTSSLLERSGRLIAIEFDRNLIPILTDKFGGRENFQLVQIDALATDFCEVIRPATQARVVANLPYNIATAILQRLIEQRRCLTEMVLMLQMEVVDRITAQPGTKDRGFLSVLVEAYCTAQKLFDVGPGSFRPAPKVWSSVMRLVPRLEAAEGVKNEKLLWQVVSAGFAQRRKTILNNLRSAPSPLQETIKSHGGASIVLCQAGVALDRRAETLSLEEWARIVKVME
ncbi:MAG TPA: 16S rRNA (adenine(1518)-N(6)/adenine(1519)-N(6))-dimethyltransferase RsmA [Pyrinomonadaceae bacterium]|nr:16S rRNA (adenine(1518)-N(6)/adenine(1519)-N(6))-dimethyltransferase RsmA [Pyrinomonadaceae bacterium]